MSARKVIAFLLVPLPSFLKVWLMRALLGYRIERGVRIWFSVIAARQCRIGRGTRIGHFNYIAEMGSLELGEDVIIRHFNILLGGDRVSLGDGALINRFNEINSILNPVARGNPDPTLIMGRQAIVTAWHKIDFTDRVTLGDSAVLAGRLSNLWTHNRRDVAPITIGARCYVGSGIQMVPGSSVGEACVVGLGAVITRKFDESGVLIAGVPARVIKVLDEENLALVSLPTRHDLEREDSR